MPKEKEENIIVQWFVWHFYQMPGFLFSVWKNYIFFSLRYFTRPMTFLVGLFMLPFILVIGLLAILAWLLIPFIIIGLIYIFYGI